MSKTKIEMKITIYVLTFVITAITASGILNEKSEILICKNLTPFTITKKENSYTFFYRNNYYNHIIDTQSLIFESEKDINTFLLNSQFVIQNNKPFRIPGYYTMLKYNDSCIIINEQNISHFYINTNQIKKLTKCLQ